MRPRGASGIAALLAGLRAGLQRARQRLVTGTWLVLQQTVAATAAWAIADGVLGHHQPFFAPIAAVVALNTFFGERGSHALHLLQGVVVGILIGELALATLGSGYGRLVVAVFVAMTIAQATGGTRVTAAQAAVGAILTVTVGNAETGMQRLVDGFIGASVALFFTQLLFSPEPLRLLRRAESAALAEMANALRLAGQALAGGDDHGTGPAPDTRTLRDRLSELARVRQAAIRVARHSVLWRRRTPLVIRENENAGRLDLLGDSCLLLSRIVVQTRVPHPEWLIAHLHELAGTLNDLSGAANDFATRQAAASRTRRIAEQVGQDLNVHGSSTPRSSDEATVILIRIVAADIISFSGADPGQSTEAVLANGGNLSVPETAEDGRSSWVTRPLRRIRRGKLG